LLMNPSPLARVFLLEHNFVEDYYVSG